MRRWRIAILLVVLIAAFAWAQSVRRRRARRREWNEPLRVAVIVLAPRAVLFVPRAAPLEHWFTSELARYRPGAAAPTFDWFGPLAASAPEFAPDGTGFFTRALHAFRLSRALSAIDARAGVRERAFGARLYLALEPGRAGESEFAEGVAEAGGDVALVRAGARDADSPLAYAAIAHELLHLVGATDKYDASGPLFPDGLVEPGQGAKQHFVEVMAQAFPDGRLPASLSDVKVGPLTAKEVGWLR